MGECENTFLQFVSSIPCEKELEAESLIYSFRLFWNKHEMLFLR